MPSLNKVMLMGHVGQDPAIKTMQSGELMANVSIATSEKYKDKVTGEAKEQTEWHRLVFFGRLAEIVQQYVTKGRAIFIEGKIRTRKWTDNNNVERHTTEILCNSLQLLGGRDNAQQEQQAQQQPMQFQQQQQYQQPQYQQQTTVNGYDKAQARTSSYQQSNRPISADDLADDYPF